MSLNDKTNWRPFIVVLVFFVCVLFLSKLLHLIATLGIVVIGILAILAFFSRYWKPPTAP